MTKIYDVGFAVELTEPNCGSAYLIGGRLALTCAHVVGGINSVCEIRSKLLFGVVTGKVVWVAAVADIALVELAESIKYSPSRLGKFPGWNPYQRNIKVPFQFYGYPEWGATIRDDRDESRRFATGGRQIEGMIRVGDESPDNLLVLDADRIPEASSNLANSSWGGASGSAIICDGLIVAVLKRHQRPDRPASLEAQPLHVVCDDPKWRSLLREHGINPEFQEISLHTSKPPTVESRSSPLNIVNITNYVDLLNWIEEKSRLSSTGIRGLSQPERKQLRQVIKRINDNPLEAEEIELKVLELVVHYVFYYLEDEESPRFGRWSKTKYISEIKQYHRSGNVIRSGNSSLSSLVEKSEVIFGKIEIADLVKKMETNNES